MRHCSILALGLLISTVVFGQSGLTGSCQNGGTYPSCVGGEVAFTGSGYSSQVRVKVVNSLDDIIDDGVYTTNNGILRFVENLSFAETYTITVNGQPVLTVTTN